MATPVPLRHGDLANHERFAKLCDFEMVVEGKTIYAVRAVVEQRLPHLASAPPELLAKSKVKPNLVHIEFKDNIVTYDAMVSLLDYIYTGQLVLAMHSLRQIIMILIAATKLGADDVATLCKRRLIGQLTVDTVFPILKMAHDHNLMGIKALCMQFCMLNYVEVVGKKSGISSIGIELFQEITMEHTKGAEVQELVAPEAPEVNIPAEFEAVHKDMAHADAVAVFSETDKTVPFHRAVLAAHSDPLLRLMLNYSGDAKKPAKIPFEGVTELAFRSLLQLVYFGRSNTLSPVAACNLIAKLVVPFELDQVRGYCEQVAGDLTVVNVLTVLEMTYLPINVDRPKITGDLRERCLSFVVGQFPKISVLQIEYMPHNILMDILKAMHSHQKAVGVPGHEAGSSDAQSDTVKALVTPRAVSMATMDRSDSSSDATKRRKKKHSKDKDKDKDKGSSSKDSKDDPDKKKHTKRSKSAMDMKSHVSKDNVAE
eukprot:TRINITY_DN239_c1_g1_i1.p1 TRINITY_DN239_c1_g1~~TRINITY_DN239_c1_g1_i1.p1  ORF type:complete len:484 (+),score=221.94 TRINITY_DN239_c1_g1_i1:133-1584(+)